MPNTGVSLIGGIFRTTLAFAVVMTHVGSVPAAAQTPDTSKSGINPAKLADVIGTWIAQDPSDASLVFRADSTATVKLDGTDYLIGLRWRLVADTVKLTGGKLAPDLRLQFNVPASVTTNTLLSYASQVIKFEDKQWVLIDVSDGSERHRTDSGKFNEPTP